MKKIVKIQYNYDPALEEEFNEILGIISGEKDLPFDLPPEMTWPAGLKGTSARGGILLRCGFAYLREKYLSTGTEVVKKDESSNKKEEKESKPDPFASL